MLTDVDVTTDQRAGRSRRGRSPSPARRRSRRGRWPRWRRCAPTSTPSTGAAATPAACAHVGALVGPGCRRATPELIRAVVENDARIGTFDACLRRGDDQPLAAASLGQVHRRDRRRQAPRGQGAVPRRGRGAARRSRLALAASSGSSAARLSENAADEALAVLRAQLPVRASTIACRGAQPGDASRSRYCRRRVSIVIPRVDLARSGDQRPGDGSARRPAAGRRWSTAPQVGARRGRREPSSASRSARRSVHGLFNADPHPGNYLVLDGGGGSRRLRRPRQRRRAVRRDARRRSPVVARAHPPRRRSACVTRRTGKGLVAAADTPSSRRRGASGSARCPSRSSRARRRRSTPGARLSR